ncbi:MAG: hypothetical protein WBB28_01980 [Crinalium sp.]
MELPSEVSVAVKVLEEALKSPDGFSDWLNDPERTPEKVLDDCYGFSSDPFPSTDTPLSRYIKNVLATAGVVVEEVSVDRDKIEVVLTAIVPSNNDEGGENDDDDYFFDLDESYAIFTITRRNLSSPVASPWSYGSKSLIHYAIAPEKLSVPNWISQLIASMNGAFIFFPVGAGKGKAQALPSGN